MKAMEDVKVHYDGTVRMGSNSIIEFRYGGDGMEATKLERQKLACIGWDTPRLQEEMVSRDADPVTIRQHDRLASLLSRIRDVRMNHFETIDETTLLPFNMDRMSHRLEHDAPVDEQGSHAQYASVLEETLTECRRITKEHRLCCFEAFLLYYLGAARLKRHASSLRSVRDVCGRIVSKMRFGHVNPGEAVGCIAAQSVGEPCTQARARHCDAAHGASRT